MRRMHRRLFPLLFLLVGGAVFADTPVYRINPDTGRKGHSHVVAPDDDILEIDGWGPGFFPDRSGTG